MIANSRVNHHLSWWCYPLLTAALVALPLVPTFATAQETKTQEDVKQDVLVRPTIDDAPLAIESYRLVLDQPEQDKAEKSSAVFRSTLDIQSKDGTTIDIAKSSSTVPDRLTINGVEYQRVKNAETHSYSGLILVKPTVTTLSDVTTDEAKYQDKISASSGDAVYKAALDLRLDSADVSTYKTRSRVLHIPLHLDAARRAEVKVFELFASTDEGKTWKKVAACEPTKAMFQLEVAADGTYWLALKVKLLEGDVEPVADSALKPVMKVIVDITSPAQKAGTIGDSVKLGRPIEPTAPHEGAVRHLKLKTRLDDSKDAFREKLDGLSGEILDESQPK